MNKVVELFISTFLLFLPAYLGNMMPLFFSKIKIFHLFLFPLDGGKSLGGQRILGSHKTFLGVLAGTFGGVVGGIIVSALISYMLAAKDPRVGFGWSDVLRGSITGGWIGLGAILGDAVKSFFKRRIGIKPGGKWIFFDQVDFILGSWLFSWIFFSPKETWPMLMLALIITPPLHFIANILAYRLGWKDVWW